MDELTACADPGLIFGALADPTRRSMLDALAGGADDVRPRAGPQALPITRQAVAKHLAILEEAGLVERGAARGREVRYRLADGWGGRTSSASSRIVGVS